MAKVTEIFNRLISFWYKLTSAICSMIIVFAMLLITTEVVARYFFNYSIQFVMQFSGYSLFLVTFLGAAWVLSQKAHISVTFMTDKFGERVRAVNSAIMKLLGFGFCCFLLYATGDYVINNVWAEGMSTDYPIRFPLVYLMIFMPIGWLFMVIEFLIQTWTEFKGLFKGSNSGTNIGSPGEVVDTN